MSVIGKKFGQLKQWTGERFGNTEKTETSEEFKRLDSDLEKRRQGIEALSLALNRYVKSIDKKALTKLDVDPKKRNFVLIFLSNAMNSHGKYLCNSEVDDGENSQSLLRLKTSVNTGSEIDTEMYYGQALIDFSNSCSNLATIQEEYLNSIKDTYQGQFDGLIEILKEVAHLKKKLNNRRLDFDAKNNKRKKEKKANKELDDETALAERKYFETLEQLTNLMASMGEREGQLISSLEVFAKRQLEYHKKSAEVLETLLKKNFSTKEFKQAILAASESVKLPPVHGSVMNSSVSLAGSKPESMEHIDKTSVSTTATMSAALRANSSMDSNREETSHVVPEIQSNPKRSIAAEPFAAAVSTPSVNQSQKAEVPAEIIKKVKALYDFDAENDDELPLKKGTIINVIEMPDEGWWVGEISGRLGLFPSNYVEEVPEKSYTPNKGSPANFEIKNVTTTAAPQTILPQLKNSASLNTSNVSAAATTTNKYIPPNNNINNNPGTALAMAATTAKKMDQLSNGANQSNGNPNKNNSQCSECGCSDYSANFRNQYDSDISTWSPQGRLFQVEYAAEAVKQGAASVGLCSKNYAVLVALKRSQGDLASFSKKIFEIDDHIGLTISGLTSDARVLCNMMRSEALSSRLSSNRPIPISRLANLVADKAQINTQRYGGRPFGVGLLLAGYDENAKKPKLLEITPSGSVFEYWAYAIGGRAQSSKTRLEKSLDSLKDGSMSLADMLNLGLAALSDSLPNVSPSNFGSDKSKKEKIALNSNNVSVGIVSEGKFRLVETEELTQILETFSSYQKETVVTEESTMQTTE